MKKNRLLGIIFFLALLAAWGFFYSRPGNASIELFPKRTFEIFPLNDSAVGGFSTSEVQAADTLLTASVTLRSGKAFTYAGVGFNLKSMNNRPVEPLDLTQFDSMEVHVASKRMNSVKLRVLTDDPVYSRNGDYPTLRVLEKSVPSAAYLLMGGSKERFAVTKFALNEFKVPEWWLSEQGLEEDDGKKYLDRSVFFEVTSGSSTLRGIPDDIEIRYARFWSNNEKQKEILYVVLGVIVLGFVVYLLTTSVASRRSYAKKLDA